MIVYCPLAATRERLRCPQHVLCPACSAPVLAEPARPLRPAAVPVRPGVRQLREPLPVPAPQGLLPAQQVRRAAHLPARQEEIAINEPCPPPLGRAGCRPPPQWTARATAARAPAAGAADAAAARALPGVSPQAGPRHVLQETQSQGPPPAPGPLVATPPARVEVQETRIRLDSLDRHLVPDVVAGAVQQQCRR